MYKCFVICLTVIIFSCSSEEKKVSAPDRSLVSSVTLKSLDGKTASVSDLLKHHRANIFYFLISDCPMCESYSLTINKLSEKYSSQGIASVGIFPVSGYSDDEIIAYGKNFHITIPFYRDINFSLTKALGVTVAPEVFVLDSAGTILYSGSIDDWAYTSGKKRMEVTEHFLEDALENIMSGKTVAVKSTIAYGCLIE